MTKEHCQFFKQALEYCGEEANVREDYSGRGMFGRTTFGIVFSGTTILMECVLTYIKETEADLSELPDLPSIRQDNMGRDTIWY